MENNTEKTYKIELTYKELKMLLEATTKVSVSQNLRLQESNKDDEMGKLSDRIYLITSFIEKGGAEIFPSESF